MPGMLYSFVSFAFLHNYTVFLTQFEGLRLWAKRTPNNSVIQWFPKKKDILSHITTMQL